MTLPQLRTALIEKHGCYFSYYHIKNAADKIELQGTRIDRVQRTRVPDHFQAQAIEAYLIKTGVIARAQVVAPAVKCD